MNKEPCKSRAYSVEEAFNTVSKLSGLYKALHESQKGGAYRPVPAHRMKSVSAMHENRRPESYQHQ